MSVLFNNIPRKLLKGKLVIVNGDTDDSFPFGMRGFNVTTFKNFIFDDIIHKWYAACNQFDVFLYDNPEFSAVSHKVEFIPLGVDFRVSARWPIILASVQVGFSYRTLLDPRNWVEPIRTPFEQEAELLEVIKNLPGVNDRKMKVYADFHYNRPYGNKFTLLTPHGKNTTINRHEAYEFLQHFPEVVEFASGRARRIKLLF